MQNNFAQECTARTSDLLLAPTHGALLSSQSQENRFRIPRPMTHTPGALSGGQTRLAERQSLSELFQSTAPTNRSRTHAQFEFVAAAAANAQNERRVIRVAHTKTHSLSTAPLLKATRKAGACVRHHGSCIMDHA